MTRPEGQNKKYWDYIEHFQEHLSQECPSGKAGLEAFRKIRAILEPHWVMSPSVQHPLRTKLAISDEPNYRWFCQYACKLAELWKIPGSESVVARLGAAQEYLNAWSELDFALKLHLSKLPCRFVIQDAKPTPDLKCDVNGMTVDIEVTSLNEREEDKIAVGVLEEVIAIAPFQHHCVAGGFVSWGPTKNELEAVRRKAIEAITEASETNRKVEANIPGLLDYHVAPASKAHLLPRDLIGRFSINNRSPTPPKDRLSQKIKDKTKRQLLSSESSVLVVYDRLGSAEEIKQFSDNHDIRIDIGTFPELACVVLVYPSPRFEAIEPLKNEKEGIIRIEHSLPDRQTERCVVWKSPREEHDATVESVVNTIIGFPANLSLLFETKLSFLAQKQK